MPAAGELLVALAILLGIAGTVVPVLPGVLLVGGAILVWAVVEGGWLAWAVALGAVAVLGLGQALKVLVPGKRLKGSGVPWWVLALGGVLGIVGFFVVPVVGLPLGFLLGVYLGEVVRIRSWRAWPTTRAAMTAVGLSILIEFASTVLAAALWAGAAVTT